jgi:hypothetical protein
MPTVPFDGPPPGRRQYSVFDVAIAHGVAGVPLGRFEQISPTAYVVSGQWPRPRPTTPSTSSFSGLAASQAGPEAPRSSPGARAVWPNLR